MKPIITPTIFVNNSRLLKERLELYEELVSRVQLDVVDESFATQASLSLDKILQQPTMLQRDIHLMTVEPVDYLEQCWKEGVYSVIAQIENMSSQKEFIQEGQRLGLKVGLAIDLETELSELDWPEAIKANSLLLMTVRAGKEGQKLSQEALKRVKLLKNKGFKGEICVDGGVNEKTIVDCVRAGADILAIGSAIWQASDIKGQLLKLTKLAEEAYEV